MYELQLKLEGPLDFGIWIWPTHQSGIHHRILSRKFRFLYAFYPFSVITVISLQKSPECWTIPNKCSINRFFSKTFDPTISITFTLHASFNFFMNHDQRPKVYGAGLLTSWALCSCKYNFGLSNLDSTKSVMFQLDFDPSHKLNLHKISKIQKFWVQTFLAYLFMKRWFPVPSF